MLTTERELLVVTQGNNLKYNISIVYHGKIILCDRQNVSNLFEFITSLP